MKKKAALFRLIAQAYHHDKKFDSNESEVEKVDADSAMVEVFDADPYATTFLDRLKKE